MAPLQKRAWWGLGLGLAFTTAFVLVFVLMGGIETFDSDQTFRIIINVIWIGALVTHLVLMDLTLRKPRMVDERDKMIRDRAPRIQWIAVIFTLAGCLRSVHIAQTPTAGPMARNVNAHCQPAHSTK